MSVRHKIITAVGHSLTHKQPPPVLYSENFNDFLSDVERVFSKSDHYWDYRLSDDNDKDLDFYEFFGQNPNGQDWLFEVCIQK